MRRIGVIGLGDMGSGMARNLLAAGFEVTGHDRNQPKMQALTELGGKSAASTADVGADVDAVFVVVMDGTQAKDVALGLTSTMRKGGVVILCSTIRASEAREIGAGLAAAGLGHDRQPGDRWLSGRAERHLPAGARDHRRPLPEGRERDPGRYLADHRR